MFKKLTQTAVEYVYREAEMKYMKTTLIPRCKELGYAGFKGTVNDDGSESVPLMEGLYQLAMIHWFDIPQHKLDYLIHSHCCKAEELEV